MTIRARTKFLPPICTALFVASYPAATFAQQDRFLEFPNERDTVSFDLSTVQMIQPGRFSIVSISIYLPDVMRFKLKVLDTLRTFCKRPDGLYPAPTETFTLGPPDLPVENIEVKSEQTKLLGDIRQTKRADWHIPYKRLAANFSGKLAVDYEVFHCKDMWGSSESKSYLEKRTAIMNSSRSKSLFDCKHGLVGAFLNEDDDPSKALIGLVRPNTFQHLYYLTVCQRVTNEPPYDHK